MRLPVISIAVVLGNLALVLAIEAVLTSAAVRPYATVVPLSGAQLRVVLAVALVLAAGALGGSLRRARSRDERRWLGQVLVMPAVVTGWIAARPAATGPVPADAVALVVVGALVVWQLRHTPAVDGRPRHGTATALLSGRTWRLAHVAAIAAFTVIAITTGVAFEGRAVLISLLLYPLYALVQMTVVLALPWPRLARLDGARAATVATALLFALLHWPNPVVMGVTAVAMLGWASEYRRGRPLWALALSMGLLATGLAQCVPHGVTQHLRVGAAYARVRAVPEIAAAASAATGRPQSPPTHAYLAALYPPVVGRAATSQELDRWLATITAARRGTLAWRFFISDEYRRKFGAPRGEAPLPGDVHWTRLDPNWRARIAAFTRPDYAQACGGTWQGFLGCLYRDILHRKATPQELAGWNETLSPRQRQRLVEVLLEHRAALRRAAFDTLTCEQLLLHH